MKEERFGSAMEWGIEAWVRQLGSPILRDRIRLARSNARCRVCEMDEAFPAGPASEKGPCPSPNPELLVLALSAPSRLLNLVGRWLLKVIARERHPRGLAPQAWAPPQDRCASAGTPGDARSRVPRGRRGGRAGPRASRARSRIARRAWIAYGAGTGAQAAGGRPMVSRKAGNRPREARRTQRRSALRSETHPRPARQQSMNQSPSRSGTTVAVRRDLRRRGSALDLGGPTRAALRTHSAG
jgi:hypothetical protein